MKNLQSLLLPRSSNNTAFIANHAKLVLPLRTLLVLFCLPGSGWLILIQPSESYFTYSKPFDTQSISQYFNSMLSSMLIIFMVRLCTFSAFNINAYIYGAAILLLFSASIWYWKQIFRPLKHLIIFLSVLYALRYDMYSAHIALTIISIIVLKLHFHQYSRIFLARVPESRIK